MANCTRCLGEPGAPACEPICTLRDLRDPQRKRIVHCSQARVAAYHSLRSTIALTGGKKELTGRTDIETETRNPGRLNANGVVFYHAALLSRRPTQ